MSSGFSRRLSKQFRIDRMKFIVENKRSVELDACDRSQLLEMHSPYGEELWERSTPTVRIEPDWMTVEHARLVVFGGEPAKGVGEAKRRGWPRELLIVRI
jgi:hypothetical protein